MKTEPKNWTAKRGTHVGKTCIKDGCDSKVNARGLCLKHYQQERKRGLREFVRPVQTTIPPPPLRVDRDDVFKGKRPKVRLSLTPEDIYGRPGAEF